MDKPGWSRLWINRSNGLPTLKYIAIALVFVQYILLIAAIGFEYFTSYVNNNAIVQRLNRHGLQLEKHTECVKTYPITALTYLVLLIMELISIFIGEWIDKPSTSINYTVSAIGIFIIEHIIAVFNEIMEINVIGSLSNFMNIRNVENRLIFTQMVFSLAMTIFFDFPNPGYLYLPTALLFITIDILNTTENSSIDASFGKDNPVFDMWHPFQGQFSTTVTALLEKAKFPKNNCVVIYHRNKYIIGKHDEIMIPVQVLESYTGDALIGYIAFVVSEVYAGFPFKLKFFGLMIRLISDLVLVIQMWMIKKNGMGVSEYFKAMKIIRVLAFILTIGENFITRRYEETCDRLVINWGYKTQLIEYIKAISMDQDVRQSPIYNGIIKIFSSRNSLESRLSVVEATIPSSAS